MIFKNVFLFAQEMHFDEQILIKNRSDFLKTQEL